MKGNVNPAWPRVDSLIRKQFHLFEGVRSEKEDRKLYYAIYDKVFLETIKFMEEELMYTNKIKLFRNLKLLDKVIKDEDRKLELMYTQIFKFLSYIPFGILKLQLRLENFTNNLMVSTLSK